LRHLKFKKRCHPISIRVCADLSAVDREVQEGTARVGIREGKDQKALDDKSRIADILQDLFTRDQVWSYR
jgi:hypothetical protein